VDREIRYEAPNLKVAEPFHQEIQLDFTMATPKDLNEKKKAASSV
jgi:hypothetical protein